MMHGRRPPIGRASHHRKERANDRVGNRGPRLADLRARGSRVAADRSHRMIGCFGTTIELTGEHDVRQLRLEVRTPSVVSTILVHQVVESKSTGSMTETRHRDDSRRRRASKGREQQTREGEVSEMVGGELRLPARWRGRSIEGHDSGVVDEDVEATTGPLVGESTNGFGIRQIEPADDERVVERDGSAVRTKPIGSGVRPVETSTRHDHLISAAKKTLRRRQPDSTVGPCHHDHSWRRSGRVHSVHHVKCLTTVPTPVQPGSVR